MLSAIRHAERPSTRHPERSEGPPNYQKNQHRLHFSARKCSHEQYHI